MRICFPPPGRSGHERPKTESGKPLLEQILFFRQRCHKGFKHRGSTQAGEGGALHTEEGRGGSEGQSGASKAAEAGNARGNARGNAGSCAGGFPGQCGDSKGRGPEMSFAGGTKRPKDSACSDCTRPSLKPPRCLRCLEPQIELPFCPPKSVERSRIRPQLLTVSRHVKSLSCAENGRRLHAASFPPHEVADSMMAGRA